MDPLEEIPLPAGIKSHVATAFHVSMSANPFKLWQTIEMLKMLALDPPAVVLTALDRIDELKCVRREIEDDPTPAVVDVNGQTRTVSEVKRKEVRVAIDAAYREAVMALRDAAPAIVDMLRGALADVIATAARSKTRYVDRELDERYEAIHALAKQLRWATGIVDGASPRWWRFACPDAVHAYELVEARRLLDARPRPANLPSIKPVSARLSDRGTVTAQLVTGVPLPLDLIASHADEWQPTIVTGPELIARAERMERERDAPAPQPPSQRRSNKRRAVATDEPLTSSGAVAGG